MQLFLSRRPFRPGRDATLSMDDARPNDPFKEGTMYTLIRSVTARKLLIEQAPPLAVSVVVAELFYKFHSFTLECLAFLATWFALDFLASTLRSLFQKKVQATAVSPH